MYRIQAHNINTGKIEVYIVDTMEERNKLLKDFKDNPDYGYVSFEVNYRGSFYR